MPAEQSWRADAGIFKKGTNFNRSKRTTHFLLGVAFAALTAAPAAAQLAPAEGASVAANEGEEGEEIIVSGSCRLLCHSHSTESDTS